MLMAYHLDHLYISHAQLGIPQQLASHAIDSKFVLIDPPNSYGPADYYCRPSFDVPVSWGPSVGAGCRHFSAAEHCGNLWDSSNMWHGSYLQLNHQASFPTSLPASSHWGDSYPPDAGLGVQEDGFSYLEARSVSLVGRQLAVRVYKEAQLGEFLMQEVRKIDSKQLLISLHAIYMFYAN